MGSFFDPLPNPPSALRPVDKGGYSRPERVISLGRKRRLLLIRGKFMFSNETPNQRRFQATTTPVVLLHSFLVDVTSLDPRNGV